MSSRVPTPTNTSEVVSSVLESTGTIWRPLLTCDLLNGESDTVDFKVPASKLRRYDATSQLSVYSDQDTTLVRKQSSTNGQDLAQSSIDTRSASDNHDTISNDCTDKSEKSSSAGSKLDSSSQMGHSIEKKVDDSNQMLQLEKVSSDKAQKHSPLKTRLWLADTPEMFYVVDSKAVSSYLSASTNSGLARMKRYDGSSQLGALLKKENVAISVDNLAPRFKRYDATSELSLYKNKNASVLKQTSSNAQSSDKISPETVSSTSVAPKMRRYDAASELSLYKQQGATSVLNLTLPIEGCPIQSFSETGFSTHMASKMRRYDATSELSLYKKQETTSVLEQTSSDAHFAVVKDFPTNDGQTSCVVSLKFDNGHELSTPESKEAGPCDQMISHGSVSNGEEKTQPPTNVRYWFEENPEAFDAIERVQSANGSDSSDTTQNAASVECKGRSEVPERKKTGLFGCWRVPLLKKHKKKQTRPDKLNEDQASTVAISTTGNTLVTLEPVDTVEPANPPFTTLRECSTFFRVPYNPISPAQPVIPKFVWRPNEQISPASKKDLANAEKKMQLYLASKNLAMPGAGRSGKSMVVAPSSSVKSTAKGVVGSADDLKKIFGL